jgi:FdrA protein
VSATAYAVRRRTYLDSILLMRVARSLSERPGVAQAAALMATPANKETLRAAGYQGPQLESAAADDLVIGVTGASEALARAALEDLDALLSPEFKDGQRRLLSSLTEALAALPGANLAVISVPGEYAAAEIRQALEHGLHVFCFSSNVPLEDEIELKRRAASLGLLLMGPDCGTAIIGGKGIGFANVVRRGPIGIVGASGTGIQAVSCLIHQAGSGVSQALGTGSRDPSDEVGGISTVAALSALLDDPDTRVVVLVSKTPGPRTLALLTETAAAASKPLLSCFLGEATNGAFSTLEEVATHAVAMAGGSLVSRVVEPSPPTTHRSGRILGLFAGGSLLLEARGVLVAAGLPPSSYELVDMGSEELTRGRPHPMIDPGPRSQRIAAVGADPSVGVLLLDIVLGRGAALDPAGDLVPSIRAAKAAALARGSDVAVVASVCGTDDDPQDRRRQEEILRAAGVTMLPTSAGAARYAAQVIV